MKTIIKISSVLLLGLMIFSSCSKQKYTASFAPSKSKTWNKVETPSITKNDVVNGEEAVVSIKEEAAPVIEKSIVKHSEINEELAREEAINPTFEKAELKQMKKDVRKTMFKAVKQNMFHKKAGDSNKLIAVILAIVLPPLGVWYYQQSITNDFWLDLVLLLTVFGSVLYALLVVLDVVSIA